MVRSIWAGPRMSIELTSMPTNGATDWRTANCPVSCTGIAENCCVGHAWRNLLEQFQPLSAQVVFKHHKAGGVGARLREALDQARPHRVGSDDKHYGNGLAGFQR